METDHIVIMAGGSGTRMGAGVPKQLLKVGNMPMIAHLFYIANKLKIDVTLVLSEANKNIIIDTLSKNNFISHKNIEDCDNYSKILTYYYCDIKIYIAIQEVANGTGGAIKAARDQIFYNSSFNLNLKGVKNYNIMVLSADVPLISQKTVSDMLRMLDIKKSKSVIYCVKKEKPYGYGRVFIQGDSIKIIEQKDINNWSKDQNINKEIESIKLVNTGIYAFKSDPLFAALDYITDNNAQGEYYLTDVPDIMQNILKDKTSVTIYTRDTYCGYDETMGANTLEQLEEVRREYVKKFQIENIKNISNIAYGNFLKEYLYCLSELSTVNIGVKDYDKIVDYLESSDKLNFVVLYEGRVVGAFSILIEQKIIHNMSSVAHVEDVVVLHEFRNIGIGSLIINYIKEICSDPRLRIYKIILESDDITSIFYEKNGFKKIGNSMRFNLI